jgi:hypothetical protein
VLGRPRRHGEHRHPTSALFTCPVRASVVAAACVAAARVAAARVAAVAPGPGDVALVIGGQALLVLGQRGGVAG